MLSYWHLIVFIFKKSTEYWISAVYELNNCIGVRASCSVALFVLVLVTKIVLLSWTKSL
jgi:hypothetical protein